MPSSPRNVSRQDTALAARCEGITNYPRWRSRLRTQITRISFQSDTWGSLAAALSLANLCFLRRWTELLTRTAKDSYLMKLPPKPVHYYAALVSVLLLSALFFLFLSLASHARRGVARAARFSFFLAAIVGLNAVREVLSLYAPYLRGPLIRVVGENGVLLLAALSAGVMLGLIVTWPGRIYRTVRTGLIVLVPFVPVTMGHALWSAWSYDDRAFLDKPLAPPGADGKAAEPRVVWIIFDELDQRLVFEERRGDLRLPELDRFRNASVYATHAYPPSSSTMTSLPSLIAGRRIRGAVPVAPGELRLRYYDSGAPAGWGTEPNVFSRARALGFNTALVGWYHPYCRILNRDLTSCHWCEIEMIANSTGAEFAQIVPNQLRSLMETSLYSPFGQSLATRQRVRNYRETLDSARREAADSSIGLSLFHLQPPHTPNPYSRRSGQFDRENSSVSGYYDGLALADRTLGELRRAMEGSGVWERTTIVISSDHWFRDSRVLDGKVDHRIPFMVKMPGQKTELSYEARFNTTLTQGLVLAVLRKEVATPQDARAWLDLHRGDF